MFATLSYLHVMSVSARWIGNHGFSIGIDDVQPGAKLSQEKEAQMSKAYRECDNHIDAYNSGKLTLQPGCNASQSLEAMVMGELNRIREDAGKVKITTLVLKTDCIIRLKLPD